MASSRTASRPGAEEFDDLDDLFNYDVGDENDPFSENYKPPVPKNTAKEPASKLSKNAAGLGIDEEVEVAKKIRAPRVKLDEHRLLSAAGIPKLRRKAKDLRLKGKGHEYSDAAKLLQFYQLWLDDLFPKARFLDALAMVEKTGHKRQMQSARMEWINEGRPKLSVEENSILDEPSLPQRENDQREKTTPRTAPIFEKSTSERPKTPVREVDADAEMGDLYDATPRASRPTQLAADSQASIFGGRTLPKPGKGPAVDDGPDEDELDALLAEEEILQAEETTQAKSTGAKPASNASKALVLEDDDFDDDMAAMAEMDGLW